MVFNFGSFLAGATVTLIVGIAVLAMASKETKCNTCGWRDECRKIGAERDCKRKGYLYWEPVE